MHKDIDLIIYYKDIQIEGLNKMLNKLKEDLKAQYPDLFPSTGKDGAEILDGKNRAS